MTSASIILFGIVGFGLLVMGLELFCLWLVRRRRPPTPTRFPGISIVKPLCGLGDDELERNLRSHVEIDYPGPWEVLLGVRGKEDPAYPLARAFAAAHPGRVRLVLQEGEPGYNPKVNQLISLTRAARYELISVTDSNIRVPRTFLREIAATLEQPNVGIATNLFVGVGEKRLGAILDNMTLSIFAAPNLAASSLMLGLDEVVGKCMAMRRDRLEEIGGWHAVKDKLAEDQQIGLLFRDRGLHAAFCASVVENVQIQQPLSHFFGRHARWCLIRYRVLFPTVLLEPVFLPGLFAAAAVAVSPDSALAWALLGGVWLGMAGLMQASARLLRGCGFKLPHLLLEPVRELVLFAAWARAGTMRWVTWRGNRVLVLGATRLARPEVLSRARNIQRLNRG